MTNKPSLVELWFSERHQQDLELRFRTIRTLSSEQSAFQRVDVVETTGFGRMLFNDGVVMTSERDEWIYHEMIAHVPMFVNPDTARVLVIGGGDGGTVRELLRHPSIEYCRMVEIDRAVVDACREHLPQTAHALGDPRVALTFADGAAFVAETDERYDLVIVDSSDPIGPATPLFGPDFYGHVHRILADHGVVVSQAESPFYYADAQASLIGILAQRFRRTHVYNYTNITYPGGLWSFAYASKSDRCPVGDLDPQRVAAAGLDFRYYNARIHRAAFELPTFQAEQLSGRLTPLRGG